MHRFYQFTDSRTLCLIALSTHAGAAATIFFYLEAGLLKACAILGIVISAGLEYRRLIRQGIILLRVDPVRPGIELVQAGQSQFYSKYKVYQTRWFAILKLVDQSTGRTLILNPGSFQSRESYRRLRFDLRRLERLHVT